MEQFFLNSGVFGVIIVVLGRVVVMMYKKQEKKQEILESEIKILRERFDSYMDKDRKEMLIVITDNTEALKSLSNT